MKNPTLSIGIIFKNDIRCIERCLKCLQPLRAAVPCELVMADTGSNDGSRKVAEQYADILIDFPWINDFAAARNAVMNRCSGEWYLSVDTDEYLREDIAELVQFLNIKDSDDVCATVIVRSFNNYELTGTYSDLMAMRLARLSTGVRFKGTVHEVFDFGTDTIEGKALNHVVLDHDGYVGFDQNSESGRAKIRRNVNLIRKELAKAPDNLLLHMQMIESSGSEPDYVDQLRQAVALVKAKKENWAKIGPPILRYAISAAKDRALLELDEWVEMVQEWFPSSMYTRLDVEWLLFGRSWLQKDYSSCVTSGERFLDAMEDFRAGKDPEARMVSTLQTATPFHEQQMKIYLSGAYCSRGGGMERALELLDSLDYSQLDGSLLRDALKNLQEIHFRSNMDTTSLIRHIWDAAVEPNPSHFQAGQRKEAFFNIASLTFTPQNQESEEKHQEFRRHAYTLYLPLYGRCELGIAAKLLKMERPSEIERLLEEVDVWNMLPIQAVWYALKNGVELPLAGRPMQMEEMDHLIGRLAQDKGSFVPMALKALSGNFAQTLQSLCWARGLALAALRTVEWGVGKIPEGSVITLSLDGPAQPVEDVEERNLAVARAFARVEKAYLPVCYAPEMLKREALFMLPPLHRFGWYCAQAFQALDRGDQVGYVRLLREGLSICEDAKDIVEFLIDHIPETQSQAPSAEMAALANQIRSVLAQYSPDDPAVAALKQSEAYQKVAHLIEGLEPPVAGGQLQ